MGHIFIPQSWVVGHLACLLILALVNRAVMNMDEQVSLRQRIQSFGYMPRSAIAESYGSVISSFPRNLQMDVQSLAPFFTRLIVFLLICRHSYTLSI